MKGEYEILIPKKDEALFSQFDLCITDLSYLEHLSNVIEERKNRHPEIFHPVLLMATRDELGGLKGEIGDAFDEVIVPPVQETELLKRVRALLQTHRLSNDLYQCRRVSLNQAPSRQGVFEGPSGSISQGHHAVMVLVDGSDGAIVDANPAACAYYGWSEEALCRLNISDIGDLSIEQIREGMGEFPSSRPSFLESVHRLADGRVRDVEVYRGPVHLGGQEVLSLVIFDVTERKRVEQELRESAERHRVVLKTAMDGFWLVDLEGRLMQVNEAYCQMSGYTEQELLGMTISDLEDAETPLETAAHIQKCVEQGAGRFESRHRRKDGTVFGIEVSVQYQPIQ